jgi:hypothetical protein
MLYGRRFDKPQSPYCLDKSSPFAVIVNYSFSVIPKKMSLAKITARLEVKPTDDEYEAIKTTRWGNRDVYPVAHDKRVYGVYDYIAYWVSTYTSWRASIC